MFLGFDPLCNRHGIVSPFEMQQKAKASRASRSLAEQRLGRTSEFARLRRLGLSARSALAAVLHAAPGSLKTFQQSPCASYDKDKLMNEASFTEGAMRFWHCMRSCGQSLLIMTAEAFCRSFQDLFKPKDAELSPEAGFARRVRERCAAQVCRGLAATHDCRGDRRTAAARSLQCRNRGCRAASF